MSKKSDALITKMKSIPPPAASQLLGLQFIELDDEKGRAVIAFDGKSDFCNPMGTIQGGFITAMLDEAMSIAAVVASGVTKIAPTLEIKTSFVNPARPGRLLGEGVVIRLGKSIAFMEGRLSAADGTLIATSSATARVVPLPFSR